MKKLKNIGFIGAAVATMILSQAVAPAAMAWGPERQTYTMNTPASKATFNSITDNAAVGDERDFVRIVEKGTNGTYTSDLTIEAEKEYEVFIYFHNDASTTYNDPAHNYVGWRRIRGCRRRSRRAWRRGKSGRFSGELRRLRRIQRQFGMRLMCGRRKI